MLHLNKHSSNILYRFQPMRNKEIDEWHKATIIW